MDNYNDLVVVFDVICMSVKHSIYILQHGVIGIQLYVPVKTCHLYLYMMTQVPVQIFHLHFTARGDWNRDI